MSDNKRVTYEEQIEMGLIKRPSNFVAPTPKQGDVLPPVRSVPNVIDPYASTMPQTVQMVTKYEATPITRAQAMVMKVHTITVFLSIMTGAAMYVFSLYPQSWQMFSVFCLWLVVASVEWCGMFALLAILDYRETPAAHNRLQMGAYIRMMETEQYHRLRAMYPEQFEEK